MERQKEKPQELQEKSEKSLEDLRAELATLKELKKQKNLMKELAEIENITIDENVKLEKAASSVGIDNIEKQLEEMDKFISKELRNLDDSTYEKHSEYIDAEFQKLESELIQQKGQLEEEITAYDILIKAYPWLEQERYKFMYSIPNKKKNKQDYESWKTEWAKVLFDYAKFAVLHIIYIRDINSEKPFANFSNREVSIREIAEELIDQELAEWLTKKKKQLRVYWKSLDGWADELYNWALDHGKLEPILIFEIRECDFGFRSLPKEDLEKVFKILEKDNRGHIIKLNDGQMSFKVKLE